MTTGRVWFAVLAFAVLGLIASLYVAPVDPGPKVPQGREKVVFWHFWGGEDRKVVESIVDRFNASQQRYFVRAVSMPGNNLDVKVFLAVAGGDPPDLINQDDPIIADWAQRDALIPLRELASEQELEQLHSWLFPAARRLVQYNGEMYGLCNGLDIRALYFNQTLLEENGLRPPESPAELLEAAERLSAKDEGGRLIRIGYLPDSRRLWAWGYVFGGEFYRPQQGRATLDHAAIAKALTWMQSFSRRFGAKQVAAFRAGDQSLPGKTFPLLPLGRSPHGRYGMIMDGQWRVRDIARSQQARRQAGLPVAQYGVRPLPAPPGGRERAGWVNGNFFVVPRNANNAEGAWQFMKFWSGLGHEAAAARICAEGGWIPVSGRVVSQPRFQRFLQQNPLFSEFVALAASKNQFPIPVIPGAPLLDREIKSVGSRAMNDVELSPRKLLERANRTVQEHLDRKSR